jgi:hypothetical protein
MIKRAFIAGLILLTAGSVAIAADSGTKYGKGVTLAAATPIADLLAKPGDYVGKAVRVDGVVTNVCEMRGCWIELNEGGKGVRLKVEDGVIVFPMTAKGKKASAEGVFEAIHTTEEQAAAMAKEHAKEGAKGDSPYKAGTSYQLKGSGAVIY